MINLNKQKNREQGFTVLFATLVGSLVLAIGLAILSITLKQITLASAGRQSQLAFYAADAGAECALYLDSGAGNDDCKNIFFDTPDSSHCSPRISDSVQCSGIVFKDEEGGGSDSDPAMIFDSYDYGSDTTVTKIEIRDVNGGEVPDNQCFSVEISKIKKDNGFIKTRIVSRGYSTCDKNNSNRFERALQLDY